MPLKYDDAYNATDPSLTDEQRADSARAIQNGVAANEVYWNSRSELEALKAQATGHGVVQRGEDETPTGVGGGTDAPAVEGTATEEPTTELGTGASVTPPAAASAEPAPSPDNPNEAIAKLRAQIVASGGTPEA